MMFFLRLFWVLTFGVFCSWTVAQGTSLEFKASVPAAASIAASKQNADASISLPSAASGPRNSLPVIGGYGETVNDVPLSLKLSLLLASLAVVVFLVAMWQSKTEPFEFRRHWGGFGSQRSGWTISRPLGGLIFALALAALALAIVLKNNTQDSNKHGDDSEQPVSAAGMDKNSKPAAK